RAQPPPASRTQRVQAARAGRVGTGERARRGRAGDGHRVPRGRRGDTDVGRQDGREAVAGPRPPAGVRVTLTAEAVVHGGETLARHEGRVVFLRDRKSTRLNSSHGSISYAVFCLKKKKTPTTSSMCTNGQNNSSDQT